MEEVADAADEEEGGEREARRDRARTKAENAEGEVAEEGRIVRTRQSSHYSRPPADGARVVKLLIINIPVAGYDPLAQRERKRPARSQSDDDYWYFCAHVGLSSALQSLPRARYVQLGRRRLTKVLVNIQQSSFR